MNKLPVLMIVFNRTETTKQVFNAVRQYRPDKLYVSADGPRAGHPDDPQCCAAVRALFDQIDWPCRVEKLFHAQNLGCRYAPPRGISWFFEQEEEGVILEDDCLPSPDFFRFCAEMLERYRGEEKVMHVGGANFLPTFKHKEQSYYFSRSPHIWGWATWRRAWHHYDGEMTGFPAYARSGRIAERLKGHPYQQWRYLQQMNATYRHSSYFNTWDWQWTFTLFNCEGLAILPDTNQICNIGYSGTHTVNTDLCARPFETLPTVLKHPARIEADTAFDNLTFRHFYRGSWKDAVRFAADCLTGRFRKGKLT